MQPYQEASQEIIRQKELPGKALGTLAKTAAGVAGGGAILNRILPFLNKYISPDLAVKGLNKIDPRLGKFVSGALGQGMSIEDVGSFIKEKVTGEKQQEEPAKQLQQPKNIIEEHSPEIHEVLVDLIGKGLQPIKAAFQLSQEGRFKRPIQELQKKTGKNFSDLVLATFGGEGLGPRSQQELGQQQPQQQDSRQMIAQQQQQPQQQQQQSQQQGGQGDSALLQALDKILKM